MEEEDREQVRDEITVLTSVFPDACVELEAAQLLQVDVCLDTDLAGGTGDGVDDVVDQDDGGDVGIELLLPQRLTPGPGTTSPARSAAGGAGAGTGADAGGADIDDEDEGVANGGLEHDNDEEGNRQQQQQQPQQQPQQQQEHPVFRVRYLPPVRLLVSFPPGYPSKSGPSFELSAVWLSVRQLGVLRDELVRIWQEESCGDVVVFTWIEALRTSAWTWLGLSAADGLVMPDPKRDADAGDEDGVDDNDRDDGSDGDEASAQAARVLGRVRCTAESALQAVRAVLDNDVAQREQIFLSHTHTCGVCYDEDLPGEKCLVPIECNHAFCIDCMKDYTQRLVEEGSVSKLVCPTPSCRKALQQSQLKQLLTEAEYDRYERLLVKQTLENMTDVSYCPRPGCATHVIASDDSNLGMCPRCSLAFCTLCGQPWHAGLCQTESPEERAAKLQKQLQGTRSRNDQWLRGQLEAEAASAVMLALTTKMCPKCGFHVNKVEGCNKMTCRCGAYFCYLCGQVIRGYEHFRLGRCILFAVPPENADALADGEDDDGAEDPLDIEAMAGDAMATMMRMLHTRKRCPECGVWVFRILLNNHMTCWQCRYQFCFQCGASALRAMHFRVSRCRHYSPGTVTNEARRALNVVSGIINTPMQQRLLGDYL